MTRTNRASLMMLTLLASLCGACWKENSWTYARKPTPSNTPAPAPTPAPEPEPVVDPEKAAAANEEGKKLWQEQNDLAGAAAKFEEAIAHDRKPRYLFNLCYVRHQLGQLEQAKPFCQEVVDSGDELAKKAQIVLDDINKQLPNASTP